MDGKKNLKKIFIRYDCSLQALVDLTTEQFLACNCVGLELTHARPWTRRFEDGRGDPRTRCDAAVDAKEGVPFGRTVGATRCRRGMRMRRDGSSKRERKSWCDGK